MRLSGLLLMLLAALVAASVADEVATTSEELITQEEDDDLEISEEVPIEQEEHEEEVIATAEQEKETHEVMDSDESDPAPGGNASEEILKEAPVQSGPFIDLLGPTLLSLEYTDDSHARLVGHYTNEALADKKVVGLYFSADWCGPCRAFTPELASFYNKMNVRRGKKDQFQIVWISRCRDFDSFGQYFTQMNWLAIPLEEALGERGQMLSNKYKVKGIPTLVLLDELGNVITTDARNKIPQDKAGIGFPWRNPIATAYMTILPKSLRHMLKSQLGSVKKTLISRMKGVIGMKTVAAAT